MTRGKLYLIPSTLGDNDPSEVIPASVLSIIREIDTYVVENSRTVRRYLSRAGLKGGIDALTMVELNEHTRADEVSEMIHLFDDGKPVGLVSEAGLPAVADPGALLVDLCHKNGIEVVPMVGPSSLMLSLMASGLNGQSFCFRGYLSAKTEERKPQLKRFEKTSAAENSTQIFIETPYRNDTLMKDMLTELNPRTRLCIAADLTLPTQFVRTGTVEWWRKQHFTIGKRPCVFLILAG